MNELKILIKSVAEIKQKHNDLAELTGENYNIFDILGVQSSELSHSSVIANLLNTKGKHGQKGLFLELFIKQVKEYFVENSEKYSLLNSFNVNISNTIKEKYTGKVNLETQVGGSIDILINDATNNIIIENKIYAEDQPYQLVRYKNFDKNAPIFYLTLFGDLPNLKSKSTNGLIHSQCFVCISYEKDIVVWLENCIKETESKPFIHETLKQYLILIKNLTNQPNNQEMEKELVKLILDESNFKLAKTIKTTLHQINVSLITKLDSISQMYKSEESKFKNEVFDGLKLIPKFKSENKTLMSFEILNNSYENKKNSIFIELYVEDYKLHNKIWTNNKNLKETLREKMTRKTEGFVFTYDFETTTEEIYDGVKSQINQIITALQD